MQLLKTVFLYLAGQAGLTYAAHLIFKRLPAALTENAVMGWLDDQIAAEFGLSSPDGSTVISWAVPIILAAGTLWLFHRYTTGPLKRALAEQASGDRFSAIGIVHGPSARTWIRRVEPYHVIILGLVIAAIGVGWQLYRGQQPGLQTVSSGQKVTVDTSVVRAPAPEVVAQIKAPLQAKIDSLEHQLAQRQNPAPTARPPAPKKIIYDAAEMPERRKQLRELTQYFVVTIEQIRDEATNLNTEKLIALQDQPPKDYVAALETFKGHFETAFTGLSTIVRKYGFADIQEMDWGHPDMTTPTDDFIALFAVYEDRPVTNIRTIFRQVSRRNFSEAIELFNQWIKVKQAMIAAKGVEYQNAEIRQ
ncbi:MAG: hypothetical protein E7813_07105 [Bradyrhizobium sp.]|uniref:hypothetical protein n=1 Tax=Bradyrhizobium sp. TaxID=376 RepID=UPI00121E9619|nr:hypothetical protein [Bradyrhizobium sp.]THD70777.1 MAG: hypothetical protein E7813_07105 [Bradyrhizobium sp.]